MGNRESFGGPRAGEYPNKHLTALYVIFTVRQKLELWLREVDETPVVTGLCFFAFWSRNTHQQEKLWPAAK